MKLVHLFSLQRTAQVSSSKVSCWTWLLVIFLAAMPIGTLTYRAALVSIGNFLIVPTEISQSDVVVPLGGGTGERLDKAAELYGAGYASKVAITGVAGARSAGRYWLDAILKELHDRGVAPNDILWEENATNTYSEATGLKKLLAEKGYRSAIIVTDPPHLRRAAYIFGKVFADSNATLHYCSSAPTWFRADGWWQDEYSFFFVMNEYQKLFYYAMKY